MPSVPVTTGDFVSVDGVLHVLLVDNDPSDASSSIAGLQRALGDRVAILHVTSLEEAIRSLVEATFDAIVLELFVKDAKGIATLAGVRGTAPSVPVVVYARELDDALMLRLLRAGAQECLSKNEVSPDGLARALSFAVERQRRLATLEAARSEAAHRATHDPLTGLANRELFLDQLDRALAFGTRYSRKTGLLFVDLDGFKAINDTRGHAVGDIILKSVSNRLLECVRRSDAVARLGGDEFVILLPDVTSRRDISFVRDSVLECLREPVEIGGGETLVCGASVGSAMSPLDGGTAQELLHAADAGMYRDKYQRRRARTPTPIFGMPAVAPDPTADQYAPRIPSEILGATDGMESVPHRLEARMREAMRRGEFEVHYQPIIDVIGDRIVALEALLRWRDPERGIVLPGTFLPLAEDTGLIVPIGERVLRSACEALMRWRAQGSDSDVRVSVNLSAVQLREQAFARHVSDILEDTGCPPGLLTLELTENSTMIDGELAIETLRSLKSLGVRLLVDDFGVGYASLNFLREAPVDGIKIDRRFVSQMVADQKDFVIVGSLVRLARGLGLDVVGEGVESLEQSQRLSRLQCFEQQGRHFCDAIPETGISSMLERIGSATAIATSSAASPSPPGAWRLNAADQALQRPTG